MHTYADPQTASNPGMEEEEVFVFPVSFAQQRLWFIDQMEPGNPLYNVPTVLLLEGPLDVDALGRALGEIVLRHEVMRTVFDVEEGEPVQVVLPWRPPHLPVHDISDRTEEERRAELERRADVEARRAFDLSSGPLFHVELVRLKDEEHVLFLTMHHIVSDGWSIGVLMREFTALYGAFTRGEPSPLDDLPIQYADFAVWQRERLSGERLEAQLAYWRDLLHAPPVLDLPTDRPRPPVPSFRGDAVGVTVPAATAAALRDLARAEGATLFMPLLAAWQTLLARHAGQADVVVGTPIANRNRSEIEGLIGFFVNALALRADLSGDPTFRELLRQQRERTFGAYAHQDLPFERIVEELAPERDPSRSPVFQVMFSLQNAHGGADVVEAAGLRIGLYGSRMESAKYDMILTLAETPEEIRGVLSFATDLFDRTTAERIVSHYAALLAEIAADPDRHVGDLPLMDEAERRQVLEGWNATERAYESGRCVHERISEQARRMPEAPAVVSPSGTLTFAELEARAAELAHRLRAAGVGPDSRVGLLLERGPDAVVGVLGILRAGAAYLALDPAYPDARLRFMLEDAGACAVVAGDTLAGRLDGFAGAVVAPSSEGSPPVPFAEDAAARGPSPDNLAYVIYTSGSTGTPKGVLVTHRGLSNYLAWFDEEVLGAEGFALPLVSRLSFDAHVRQLFPQLLRGEPVWVLPEETVTDPAALLEALSTRERVSFGGVPSLWSAMLERVRSGESPRPAGLKAVLLGGEALSPELAERTFAEFPDVAVWNHYGPTEATVNTTVARVRPGEPVTIGRPVGNVRVYLLDARGNPVPVGVPGELYVGGAGVSRGYLGRPDLTAEKFLPDPFSREAGARMYRSGDRVRWRADGELDYVGRVDQQVKVRGFRIEPGEIEAALERHPEVRGAAVVVREDASGASRLVGYVVPEAGASPAPAELRAYLAERLPEYMVPGTVVLLEALPLSANGKVDRRALPAPEAAGAVDEYVAPRTPTEEILAGIYAEVLKLERVGAEDDFFVLGGHSLLATRVVSRIRAAFGAEVPLRSLFEAPVVSALAARVDAAVREGVGTSAPPIVPVPRGRPLPASFAQQRLWFIQQMSPDNTAYNMHYALRLRGALDVRAMERAFDALRERHESLRTVFAMADGVPVQVVAPAEPRPLPVDDLRDLPDAERAAEVRRRVQTEASTPFDLERGPLLRAGLLRLADDEWGLLLTLHHIVTDGWSTGILVGELSALYTAYSRGEEPRLPALPVQYPDFAAWQRSWLAGDTLDRQLEYWRQALGGAPPLLEIPTDHPRPPVQSPRGGHRPILLSPETTRALRELTRREGATLFMTLLAGWQALLSRWSGQDDVSVGTPIAGRNRVEVEGLIGFFVNTLVLRADLSEDPSLRTLLTQVRETTLGAYAHQDIPFEKLVEELQPERSLQHTPLFQTLFVLQNNERGWLRLGDLEAEALGREGETTQFDLALALVEDGERLFGSASYRAELFDPETVDAMLRHFSTLLDGAVADPDRPLSTLPLLTEGEREEVLVRPNQTRRAYPSELCLHEMVEAQVRRTPDAVVLVAGEERVTLAELNRAANRIARVLRAAGVGPEVRVGIFLERTPAVIAALLGVLKAGGTYLPLDPAYPLERTRVTLEDASARVILTQTSLVDALPPGHGAEVMCLDADRERFEAMEDTDFPSGAGPDNAAYLIYTSGSTGKPKGVVIRHLNAVALMAWAAEVYPLEERAGILASTSICFDLSIFEIFLPLTSGGTAILARNVLQLPELAAAAEVTLVNTVPSALAELVRAGGLPATVRTVGTAGETLPAALAQEVYRLGVRRVVNMYGPSEDTTYSTWSDVPRGELRPLAIGRPLYNTRFYVLDRVLQPVPVGVRGELYLAGDGLARGYLERPDLTADRWVPDPFGEAGERMYRSGDFTRLRRDGQLEFMGRVDQQVKVRGFRIEPGEIEAVLLEHPALRDVVVIAREDVPGDRRLVAYLVARGESVPPDAELRARIRERLPEYMVPSAFVALDALPVTASRKLDRRALPAPGRLDADDSYVAPRDATEQELVRIWEEVLRRGPVGVHDNFFALGGHSLLVMQVLSRVRTAFGVELPIPVVFEKPTIAELAAVVTAPQAQVRRTGPIRRADRSSRILKDPG